MSVPGSNLLNKALRAIRPVTVAYHKFTRREENEQGIQVAVYAAAVGISGSFQPIPRSLYQANGLDFNAEYWNFYVSAALLDVTRDVSGDQISFNGDAFQCLSTTPWSAIDGWNAVLCVKIRDKNAG